MGNSVLSVLSECEIYDAYDWANNKGIIDHFELLN